MFDLWMLDSSAVVVAPGTDQHVGDVFLATRYLVTEEQGTHFPFDNPASAAEGADRAADHIERDGMLGGVKDLANLADAEGLRRPVADIADFDEPGIKREQ